MLSHQNLILDMEVTDIVVQVDIFADEECCNNRVFHSSTESQPR